MFLDFATTQIQTFTCDGIWFASINKFIPLIRCFFQALKSSIIKPLLKSGQVAIAIDVFQSECCAHHKPETAYVKVLTDLWM